MLEFLHMECGVRNCRAPGVCVQHLLNRPVCTHFVIFPAHIYIYYINPD